MDHKLSFLIWVELVRDTCEAPKQVIRTFPPISFPTAVMALSIFLIRMPLFLVSLSGKFELTTTMASVPSLLNMWSFSVW